MNLLRVILLITTIKATFSLAAIVFIPFVDAFMFGYWGVILGALIWVRIYIHSIDGGTDSRYPAASTCLKCGSISVRTASIGRRTGYGCSNWSRFETQIF
jgi:hypothetical protein